VKWFFFINYIGLLSFICLSCKNNQTFESTKIKATYCSEIITLSNNSVTNSYLSFYTNNIFVKHSNCTVTIYDGHCCDFTYSFSLESYPSTNMNYTKTNERFSISKKCPLIGTNINEIGNYLYVRFKTNGMLFPDRYANFDPGFNLVISNISDIGSNSTGTFFGAIRFNGETLFLSNGYFSGIRTTYIPNEYTCPYRCEN